MRVSILGPLMAIAASVSAISITFPGASSDSKPVSVDFSKSNDITWTKVSTDPSDFKLTIKSVGVFPVQEITIASSVASDDLKYTLAPLTDSQVTVGGTYQVTFYSTSATNTGIFAQSGQFTVAKVASKSASSSVSSAVTSSSSARPASTSASSSSSSSSAAVSSSTSMSSSRSAPASASSSSSVRVSSLPAVANTTTSSGTTMGTIRATGASLTSSSTIALSTSNAAAAPATMGAFNCAGVLVGLVALLM